MKDYAKLFIFITAGLFFAAADAAASNMCYHNGIPLQGRVKVVKSFPDLKVRVVSAFPDVRVKKVSSFPNSCGEWQFVDSFPDFTIQWVDSFPDIKIQWVDAFPGK